MYDQRIKIFLIASGFVLLLCLVRLVQMQWLDNSYYREQVSKLKEQGNSSQQLKTVRGRILDRHGRAIASDEPRFYLQINYRLSSYLDERVRRAKLLKASNAKDPVAAIAKAREEIDVKLGDIKQVIEKCSHFNIEPAEIQDRLNQINNEIWNFRSFIAWVRNGANPKILEKYDNRIIKVPGHVAIADLKSRFPNEDELIELISKVDDIPEMDKTLSLVELETDADIFTAQLEFTDMEGLSILPVAQRVYYYNSAACQTIGWVGPEQQRKLFANDKLLSYLAGEVSGGRPGVEYVCEGILRGKRGEMLYDIDEKLIKRTETQPGDDVRLTLDIELQEKIENFMADSGKNRNSQSPSAVVVIDVGTGDILALVSMPVFELNRIRYDYKKINGDPCSPMLNRAINEYYPGGSAVKPLILIAGLETGKITKDSIISCPAHQPEQGWPRCWIQKKYSWLGHDGQWADSGGNIARNALKGSCNIYFSRLANRIEPVELQRWLFNFGYGHNILSGPASIRGTEYDRNLRQLRGAVSSKNPPARLSISSFEDLKEFPLLERDRKWFGIGQGNLWVTPLQVANAMAVIARDGLYKAPQLYIDDKDDAELESHYLSISPGTLEVVRDGMHAVVSERSGTAYEEFKGVLDELASSGVTVYGKTGSTERPEHAWFAGFAEDDTGQSIALSVLVEGGEHGSSDAGPIAREVIKFCIEAGYIGRGVQSDE